MKDTPMINHILSLTSQERTALVNMLQEYREHQEELYNHPDNPDSLFTQAQRQLFTRFDVISIKKEQSS
jgi:hypothetical protein